jgi:gamma-glutamyltranspeptidase / glutathione hydrolase
MMWFDPMPGRPNSVGPWKRPLANMCPAMVTRGGEPIVQFGASGGRKILPAVVQIFLRVALLGQSLAEAIAAPRLDTSTDEILADVRFGEAFARDLARRTGRPVRTVSADLAMSPWASPVGLMREGDEWTAGGDLYTLACAAAV